MPASQADSVVNMVGVNTHVNWRTTVYAQDQRVMDLVRDLGVRHVRDRITKLAATRAAFSELAKSGVKVQGVCGALGDPQSMSEVMSEVVAGYSDPFSVFSGFEGLNEPNNDAVPWVDETRAKLRDLRIERDLRGLNRIPVIGPALARVNGGGVEGDTTEGQSTALGDLTDVLDLGNVHVYPRVQTPSADIDRFVAYQRLVCGNKPIVCSEGGYFTAMDYVGGAWPTPVDVVGTYLPRMVMEHWLRGTTRFFAYELMDRYDATNSDRLSSFGLVGVPSEDPAAPWTKKPGYRALKNLLSIMADPGGSHKVAGIPMTVTGGTDLRKGLFAKRDGSRYLAVWRDVSCYDALNRTLTPVQATTATLTFDTRRTVSVYSPTVSATPVASYAAATSVKLSVGGELLIARIG
ncbi:hypothetical protein [Nocardioides mesophilus]|uniref:Uncharacterized protein n=1 Tax=Nocardioides mesophilus TaxID=433659 RepID=A0A7G9REK3_9ACTN|nr:hypothetical protein [Nocardioides mesophilus]QNN54028.1 hypothetical protein H9L09_06520 [Nocardioides mesophilus]